jgi:hypothetical protein
MRTGAARILKIQQYDTVKLKDGQIGVAVEVFGEDEILVDVGSSPKDWDTISVTLEDIESVVRKG